jgi:hypothetical protein
MWTEEQLSLFTEVKAGRKSSVSEQDLRSGVIGSSASGSLRIGAKYLDEGSFSL